MSITGTPGLIVEVWGYPNPGWNLAGILFGTDIANQAEQVAANARAEVKKHGVKETSIRYLHIIVERARVVP